MVTLTLALTTLAAGDVWHNDVTGAGFSRKHPRDWRACTLRWSFLRLSPFSFPPPPRHVSVTCALSLCRRMVGEASDVNVRRCESCRLRLPYKLCRSRRKLPPRIELARASCPATGIPDPECRTSQNSDFTIRSSESRGKGGERRGGREKERRVPRARNDIIV